MHPCFKNYEVIFKGVLVSNELKLGIFVTIGILAVLLTIMLLGNYSLTSKYIVNLYEPLLDSDDI